MNLKKKINNFITKDYKSANLNAGFMINPYRFVAVSNWNYNHDFSTDDGKWTFNNPSSTNQVDTSAGLLRTDTTSSDLGGINRACSGDIFGGVVSDTAWVLQIDKLTYTSLTPYAQNSFGMSEINYSVPSYQQALPALWQPYDLLFFYTYQAGSTNCSTRLGYTSGGTNGGSDTVTSTTSLVANMYYQLIRTSATSATGQWGTNSNFTSPTVSLTNTAIPSTINNLRYAKFGNLVYTGFSEGAMVGNFDALRFANGVTVAP